MLEEEPNDPFLIYAIGTELLSSDASQARVYFEKLLTEYPDYAGTYYHVAQLYADLGEREKCIASYEKGLQVLLAQKNTKLYNELQRAYRNFLDEEED
jgi:Tfp pilus assembly protein PilF